MITLMGGLKREHAPISNNIPRKGLDVGVFVLAWPEGPRPSDGCRVSTRHSQRVQFDVRIQFSL